MRICVGICSVILIMVFTLFSAGCTVLRRGDEKRSVSSESPPGQSDCLDPLDLPADREVVPARYPLTADLKGRGGTAVEPKLVADSLSGSYNDLTEETNSLHSQVFRVQLFTSELFGEAQHARVVAEEIFDRPVDIDYEVPYFKVRVGSFPDRDEAEGYLQRVRAAGYKEAWVVVTNISVREAKSLYLKEPFLEYGDDNSSDSQPVADE